jgi:hypothetical protein
MTVTYGNIQRIDEIAFLVTWTSDQPTPVTFRVYSQGVLVQTIVSTDGTGSYILTVGAGESPFFEVLDMACQNPSIAFPGRITLNWLAVSGAVAYSVQELVGTWTERMRISDLGQGVFTFLTRWLEDSETHSFQIVPVDSAGDFGTPIPVTFLQVRHPDVPNVTYSLNGSNEIQVVQG